MNNLNFTESESRPHLIQKISPETYEGIYHSRSINKTPAQVYAFCQSDENFKKVLQYLPNKIKNFLDLEFVQANSISKDTYQVEWRNVQSSETQGRLILTVSPDAHKGSVLIANAIFANYTMENDEPSDLINILLKRIKALSETGELATTRGQPNGNDEKEINKTLKH